MGTNFYLHQDVCKCCKRAKEQIHIGKSSSGWRFSLHVKDPSRSWDEHPANLEEWKVLFADPNSEIRDEYGEIESKEKMILNITERQKWRPGQTLLAHDVDRRHCIGHGEDGDYDLIVGDFS